MNTNLFFPMQAILMMDTFTRYWSSIIDRAWAGPRAKWIGRVPSMMDAEENMMLFEITRKFPRKIEHIVDGGAFLGASTVCFGQALSWREKNTDESYGREAIYSYDLFETTDYVRHFVEVNLSRKASNDPDYLFREYIHNVGEFIRYTSLIKGDVRNFPWKEDKQIDILFLVFLKTEDINEFAITNFFPHLIAQESIVIQQDYFHELVPWIPLTMELMSDHFEHLTTCCSSALFKVIKPITSATSVQMADEVRSLSTSDKITIFDKIQTRFAEPGRLAMLELSKIRAVLADGDIDRARHIADALPADYLALKWPAELLRRMMINAQPSR